MFAFFQLNKFTQFVVISFFALCSPGLVNKVTYFRLFTLILASYLGAPSAFLPCILRTCGLLWGGCYHHLQWASDETGAPKVGCRAQSNFFFQNNSVSGSVIQSSPYLQKSNITNSVMLIFFRPQCFPQKTRLYQGIRFLINHNFFVVCSKKRTCLDNKLLNAPIDGWQVAVCGISRFFIGLGGGGERLRADNQPQC